MTRGSGDSIAKLRPVALAVFVVALAFVSSGCAWMIRASVTGSGAQANGWSGGPALSDDGRFVAFPSDATNLVPGDTNNETDIFVRDNLTQAVERVSISTTGVQANADSLYPSISDDGRIVSFASSASNLAPGDTNPGPDFFVHDRVTGATELVSTVLPGSLSNSVLSADGRYVGYTSGQAGQIVVVDRQGTSRVLQCPGAIGSMSDDGRYISFRGPCGIDYERVVYDLQTSTPRILTSVCDTVPIVSGNGRWAACGRTRPYFPTPPPPVLPAPPLSYYEVAMVIDLDGTSPGTVIDTYTVSSNVEAISDDGRYLNFSTQFAWAPDDTDGRSDVYVRDRVTGATTLVTRGLANQVPADEYTSVLSGDGRYAAFSSFARDFVANDTNGTADVFVRAIPTPAISSAAPASVARGATAVVTLHGDALLPSSVVGVYGAGVTVNSTTWISDQELRVSITVAPDAATGARSYAVRLPGTGPGPDSGASALCFNCLTVS
jgi:Tol biopolymer transport system component